ncbi:ABC transporter ATP-binding protein [Martelella mediterranea]|uniref:ABC transporter ATP-binding protein n=1 Tax=Martelella mediterranea TaxID=293089 RepID=UPI001E44EFB0|nr:ABC transporter ATP-binding protein [Martelella mediterranea]MCD1632543.1 ABC transporter ATP-binding protein [Martelella mediterranea]
MTVSNLLEIDHLNAAFDTRRGELQVLSDIHLDIGQGEIVALVGESGAGKSLTGSAINGLLPARCRVTGGEIRFEGKRIDTLSEREMQRLRGAEIGTIFQDPLTSLNPLYTVAQQLIRTIRTHEAISREAAEARALTLLEEVGIPAPADRLHQYPHEFSGGMRQRVVIALAIALRPKLIIADEPTTALDVSIQAQILELLRGLSRDHGTSIILVTHDMGVVAETADRVAVLYAGRIVEVGKVEDVLMEPRHPYTRGLLASIPSIVKKEPRLPQIAGSMPSLTAIPSGCAYRTRCNHATERCALERPALRRLDGRDVACHYAEELI